MNHFFLQVEREQRPSVWSARGAVQSLRAWWMATTLPAGSRSPIPGLYLCSFVPAGTYTAATYLSVTWFCLASGHHPYWRPRRGSQVEARVVKVISRERVEGAGRARLARV
jgi:hypothetical protein